MKDQAGIIHLGISLDFMIDGILEQRKGGRIFTDLFQDENHKDVSIESILAQLFTLKSQGYTYYPMCDNIDKSGACLGHSKSLVS